jgi:hypothetical protein
MLAADCSCYSVLSIPRLCIGLEFVVDSRGVEDTDLLPADAFEHFVAQGLGFFAGCVTMRST